MCLWHTTSFSLDKQLIMGLLDHFVFLFQFLNTIFHICYSDLYTHQPHMKVLFSLRSFQNFLSFAFLIIVILICQRDRSLWFLIYIFLRINNIENVFIYPLAILMFSLISINLYYYSVLMWFFWVFFCLTILYKFSFLYYVHQLCSVDIVQLFSS